MISYKQPLLVMNKEACVTEFMVQNAMDITTIAFRSAHHQPHTQKYGAHPGRLRPA
jgi:hypothetical protein